MHKTRQTVLHVAYFPRIFRIIIYGGQIFRGFYFQTSYLALYNCEHWKFCQKSKNSLSLSTLTFHVSNLNLIGIMGHPYQIFYVDEIELCCSQELRFTQNMTHTDRRKGSPTSKELDGVEFSIFNLIQLVEWPYSYSS